MESSAELSRGMKHRTIRNGLLAAAVAGAFAFGVGAPELQQAPASAAPRPMRLPSPPADGVMGFVVEGFYPPVVMGKDACPTGPAPRLRDVYLNTQAPAERQRLALKENEQELTQRWHAYAFGPNGTNICSQPDMFDHPLTPTVQSKMSWGLDLDGGSKADTCDHEDFVTPNGEKGIDNQEYRALGCTLEYRGVDGISNDIQTGMKQFHSSGEWTQVILLRGVDSLQNDNDVEVIYANTADRPAADSKGKFLRGSSFTIDDTEPRHRNVLHARIVNGVLTTDPGDIALAQTWGQGGARDIRGNRGQYRFAKARLRLQFQSDGSVTGMLGGYRPLFDVIEAEALGGAGTALVAGIDCASYMKTLRRMADGLKDPKTGQCHGISSAFQLSAIPAFVNDIPAARTAARR
ncbi:hypothetical protein KRR38_25940 [Novosphingobium sp. G106]|uniref:hypothetical protein n=1 Tax=Novosphingobium sp. G106 TaxID=2849500 RepID=UPI001C2D342D|nr:hypothetical protein [Novosphingobium sp. G106]MBV1691026.1 hypothetical protein [Novosphingobium sp. G106]